MSNSSYSTNRHLRRNLKLYWGMIIVVSVAMAYVSFTKFSDLFAKSVAIDERASALATLENTLSQEESEYAKLAELHNETNQKILNDLQTIFPKTENYTNLTREMDQFFLNLSRSDNPIFVSNLQYGTPRLDSSNNFSLLPITLSINSSKKNFLAFLDYIEQSGNLGSKVRLMDIEAIKINFASGSKKDEVNLNVTLNAYFQKSEGAQATNQ